MIVNRKKVHRIMCLHRWTCRQRIKSIASAPNQRWATVDYGRDG